METNQIRRQIVAVDAMNMLYHAARNTPKYVDYEPGGVDGVIDKCHSILSGFESEYQADPVLVLDGRSPEQKKQELVNRRKKQEAAKTVSDAILDQTREKIWEEEKKTNPDAVKPSKEKARKSMPKGTKTPVGEMAKATSDPVVKKAVEVLQEKGDTTIKEASRQSIRIPRSVKWAIIHELRRRGYRYKLAPGEAEAQAAWWSLQGFAVLVVTRDWDAFLFGARYVARDYDNPGNVVTLRQAHGQIRASCRKQMLEAHILAGKTDYAPRLKGVRSVRDAIKRMKESGGFEETLDSFVPGGGSIWSEAKDAYLDPVVCKCRGIVFCQCD